VPVEVRHHIIDNDRPGYLLNGDGHLVSPTEVVDYDDTLSGCVDETIHKFLAHPMRLLLRVPEYHRKYMRHHDVINPMD
jgi:hypothetical protein